MQMQHVSLSKSEHEFYVSGVARGRAEGFDKIADQLQAAHLQYVTQLAQLADQGDPDWKEVAEFLAGQFETLSKQIRPLVKESRQTAHVHLEAAIKVQKVTQPGVVSGSFDLTMEAPNA